jgi:hypothetical protein
VERLKALGLGLAAAALLIAGGSVGRGCPAQRREAEVDRLGESLVEQSLEAAAPRAQQERARVRKAQAGAAPAKDLAAHWRSVEW